MDANGSIDARSHRGEAPRACPRRRRQALQNLPVRGLDGDGTPNALDDDDDGDGILDTVEIGLDPQNPLNTDADAEPDYRDTDRDADGISDRLEGSGDFDADGTGNWRDLDADGDCRTDALERGGGPTLLDSEQDGRPDFLDRDSDDDGISDRTEDADCNGARNGAETSAVLADTDGDGAADLVEQTFATSPIQAASNPADAGLHVVIAPYSDAGVGDAGVGEITLPFQTRIRRMDVYGLRTLTSGVPVGLSAEATDSPLDMVDAVAAFVRSLSTAQLGTPQCTAMLTELDTDGDLLPDSYADVRTGTPVCWRLAVKPNTTVPPLAAPQVIKVTVTAYGDGSYALDAREVSFYVPPLPIP